jgi:cathepsin B
LTITPEILHPGSALTITMDGELDETITGGTVHVEVKFLGVKVFERNFDLCHVTPDVKCPIPKGHFGPLKMTETLPKTVPKGKYTGLIKLTDQKGEEIACVLFQMEVKVGLNDMVLDDALIQSINAENAGWTAGRNDYFEGMTVGEAIDMLLPVPDVPETEDLESDPNFPDEFDARKKWPSCIHPVRDQGHCGSCWAFGLSEVLSDRFCIASHGSVNVVLSPQYLVSCDKSDMACKGGYLDRAWSFAAHTGICTDHCSPYASGGGSVPSCPSKCKDGSAMKMFKAKNTKSVHGVSTMQDQMYNHGPIEGAFKVYQDFMSYKSGVYQHKTGSLLGGHAIKCMGWGVSGNTPYWFCQNSWNTSWGDHGYFKILRGKNECGIESLGYTGDAAV